MIKSKDDLSEELCNYCPLDIRGVYSVPGGFVAGCEGSRCTQAYENYLEMSAAETAEMGDTFAQQAAVQNAGKQ